ncbi:hypothetical protein RWH45_06285 [Microbacterium sp. KSW4-17]|uniref:SseB protein N-terminal domain-containing protein n=1 Tax=Microbacterium galbum TaxID=3075994 RepID=A0ABU3T625_9MICO|nr:hypothetical protein [Microbacterium sp. KSW4-17]MDU0366816.1 hypothetical protein [Microbacterium sp. KSW4-17]
MSLIDPTPETVATLDALSDAARAQPTSFAAMDALWRAVYALPHWSFIARGPDDAPSPFIGQLANGPMVFAFTTRQRAHDGALANGLDEEAASRVLSVPLPGAVEWLAGFAQQGVVGVVFDMPAQGYTAPLQNFLPMQAHIASAPPA